MSTSFVEREKLRCVGPSWVLLGSSAVFFQRSRLCGSILWNGGPPLLVNTLLFFCKIDSTLLCSSQLPTSYYATREGSRDIEECAKWGNMCRSFSTKFRQTRAFLAFAKATEKLEKKLKSSSSLVHYTGFKDRSWVIWKTSFRVTWFSEITSPYKFFPSMALHD